MPIEFHCTTCQKLLRTGDDTAGKQAKCPHCGTILQIPQRSEPSPAPPTSPPASPFGPAGADTANPYQSPGDYTPLPGGAYPAVGASGQIQPTPIDMNDVLSRTWTIYKERLGTCILGGLIIIGINFGLSGAEQLVRAVVEAATRSPAAGMLALILAQLAGMFVVYWIIAGQIIYFLKIARGQQATAQDLFTGGPYFINLLVAAILVGLMTMVGFVACVVPGIILFLMFSQFLFFIVDRNAGILDSLSLSNEFTRGNKLTLFLLGLVVGLVGMLVACTCVGYFFVVPFGMLLQAVVYLAMTGQPTVGNVTYAPPGPFAPVPPRA